jgi:hypothetical protein
VIIHKATKDLLKFLQDHPEVRTRIRADTNKTVLYSGEFFKAMWKEVRDDPAMAGKQTLEFVLNHRTPPGKGHANLADYVQAILQEIEVDPTIDKVSVQANHNIIWRALSGIFASNAVGKVSFQIGRGVLRQTDPTKKQNVFAATEIDVLLRNPQVDATTKDLLAYFKRCIQSKQADINLGFISA